MINKPSQAPNPAQEIRLLVAELTKRQRLDLASLSKRLGKNHAYLQQYIKRGVPHILPEEVRPPLARLLGCRADDLRPPFALADDGTDIPSSFTGEMVALPVPAPPFPNPPAPANFTPVAAANPRGGKRGLPVFGAAKGGWDGSLVDWENPAEWLPVPPELLGVNEAFAMFVTGDSMEPRYSHGDMVYCHPSRPATRGCYVVVVKKSGDTLIKQFVRQQDGQLELRQFNPESTTELPLTDISSIYRIVGQWERG